jgi:uncharacterized membrane protein
VAVVVAIALAVACLACLLYFIHHMASSIQASRVVDRIARETEAILDDIFPRPLEDSPIEEAPVPMPAGIPVLAERSGYIRTIDQSSLLNTAQAFNVLLRIDRYIGQFVMEGTPILVATPRERVNDRLRGACLRGFAIGSQRTMLQDVEFGTLQIVDIALKAISPAVNDPTTALTCIDQLGRILLRAALREPPAATIRDRDGHPRVILRRTSFPRLLNVAFSQITHYGKADVAVPLRLLRVLGELAGSVRHPPYVAAVLEQARCLAAACALGFPEADRDELNERLAAVEEVAASISEGKPNTEN